jgi:hypothetical protein
VELLKILSGRLVIRQAPNGDTGHHGLFVLPGGISGGIDDQPVTRRSTAERPNAHGEFDVPGFLAGRLIPVKGICLAESPSDLQSWRDRVVGHGADGGLFGFSVVRNGFERFGSARLAAGQRTTFDDDGTGLRAKFTMTWWAANPRLYQRQKPHQLPTPGASITLVNDGNFASTPRLIVTGTPQPTGYTITGPGGREIVVRRPLNAGETHEIDMSNGRFYVNGVRVIRAFAKLQRFAVPADNAIQVSITGGTLDALIDHTFV